MTSIYDDFSSHFHIFAFYSPWHDPTEDPVATNLIYQQNVRGVKFGEYRCEKEEDLAMIAAQQYYIEYGNDLNEERLFNLIPNYIPDYCLQRDNAIEMWHHLVLQAYKKVMQKQKCCNVGKVTQKCLISFFLRNSQIFKIKLCQF